MMAKIFNLFFAMPSENGVTEIVDWLAVFRVPEDLMSDGLSRLKNEAIFYIAKGHNKSHAFTPSYSPSRNERMKVL